MSESGGSPGQGMPADDQVEDVGHFRIYLGAAAGVGKTCAMLSEGRRRASRGADIVVGYVETHGRLHTAEFLEGLDFVPRRQIAYRGTVQEEMDTQAVIARHPKVALIDELAHTNVPGAGYEKRWQDVLDILDAGIDVITTVNIQHIESLADTVERVTGAKVKERVPDWVVRRANQVELVDSSPEALRRRMVHGNIYPAAKVPAALSNFFRTENLTALREMALRFLADETDEKLLGRVGPAGVVWETAERIMVAVTAAPGTDALVRRSARIAARSKAELHVVHVRSGDQTRSKAEEGALASVQNVAEAVGAIWHQEAGDEPAAVLMDFASRHQITQIVIGSSNRSRWQQLRGGGSVVRQIIRAANESDTDVHVIARRHVDRTDDHAGDQGG